MKKILLPFISMIVLASCGGKKSESRNHEANEPKTQADSLMKYIDDGHMVGMSKIGKLHNIKKEVQAVIDSIGKLPAKAQQAVALYVEQLKTNIKDLDYADFAMDKWMTEFEMDSAIDNMGQRIKYLTDEKMKDRKSTRLNSSHQ